MKGSLFRSKIIYVPMTQNSKADSLAHSVRKQLSFVVHMDADLPVWFTESVLIMYKLMTKKKFMSLFITFFAGESARSFLLLNI